MSVSLFHGRNNFPRGLYNTNKNPCSSPLFHTLAMNHQGHQHQNLKRCGPQICMFSQFPRTPHAPRSEYYFLETIFRASNESSTSPISDFPLYNHSYQDTHILSRATKVPVTASPEVPTSLAVVSDSTSWQPSSHAYCKAY